MDIQTTLTYTSALGAVEISPDGPVWVSEIKGASGLPVELAKQAGFEQIGETITSQTVRGRSVTLNGCVRRNVRYNRQHMLDVIAPLQKGVLTVNDAGRVWYLEVYPTQAPDFTDGPSAQDFQITLFAQYPYWRTTARARTLIGGLQALFRIPFHLTGKFYISRYSQTFMTNVPNTGNVSIPFTAIFKAVTDVVAPELYHVNSRTFIRILGTIEAGQTITVNTTYQNRTVTLTDKDGTVSDAFHRLDLDSNYAMMLEPGDNVMRYTAQQNREGLRLYIVAEEGVVNGI